MVLAPNGNIVSIDQLNPDSENLFTSIINVGGPMWKTRWSVHNYRTTRFGFIEQI